MCIPDGVRTLRNLALALCVPLPKNDSFSDILDVYVSILIYRVMRGCMRPIIRGPKVTMDMTECGYTGRTSGKKPLYYPMNKCHIHCQLG